MHMWQRGLLIAGALILLVSLPTTAEAKDDKAAQLTEREFLFEVIRHLYRWYLDEKDVNASLRKGEFVFWVRELKPQLDPGDKSCFGQIIMPALGASANVKWADYTIPKLGVEVKSDGFKITRVSRVPGMSGKPDGFTEVRATYDEIRDYAHKHRNDVRFPEGDLLMRMRITAHAQFKKHPRHEELVDRDDLENVVHFAPLSPVANETWVFWEAGRLLIRFASDMDLENPAMWEHDELAVDFYDLDEQVVVSLDEVAGSNAYLTRDQVGRALFNCIVLGQRVELDPDDVPKSDSTAKQ